MSFKTELEEGIRNLAKFFMLLEIYILLVKYWHIYICFRLSAAG